MAEEEDGLYSLLERAKDLAVEVEDYGLAKELKAKLAYLKSPRAKQSASPNVEDMDRARFNKPVDPPPNTRGSAPPDAAMTVQTLRKNRRNNKISPQTNAANALAVMALPNVEMRRKNTLALPTSQLWRKSMKPTTGTVFWINTDTGEITDIDPTNPSQKHSTELQRQMRAVQAAAHMKQHMEQHYNEEGESLELNVVKSYMLVCGCCPCFCLAHCCCPQTCGTNEHIDRVDLQNCSKHHHHFSIVQYCGHFALLPCRVLGFL